MTVSTTVEPVRAPRALLWQALGQRRRDLVTASILYSTHQLGESMVPVIIGATIGQALGGGGNGQAIAAWLVVLALDFILLSLSYRFAARASMRAKQHTGHTVRMWMTDRIVHPGGGIGQPPGELLSRASSDATRVGSYAGVLASTIAAVTVLIASIILLLRLSPLLAAIIVTGTMILLATQSRLARVLRRRSSTEQREQAHATALAEDVIRGVRVLRGIGAAGTAAASYTRVSQSAATATLRAASAQGTLSATATMLNGVYLTMIAGVGGWLALTGHLGLGQLVAALGLAQFLIGPMRLVSGASAAYARALASAARIQDVLSAGHAVIDGPVRPEASTTGRAAIEFDHVLLGAVRLDATVNADGMTGFVCADAVLATEVRALLAREHDPEAGRIRLAGIDIAELPLDVLRERILASPHDAALFPGTIGENLTALSMDSTNPEASAAAYADQVLTSVPGGLDASVGDRGELLSGGQRQRIALARALAAEPDVLVLHDPTTAVDAATEDQIAQRVAHLRDGRTTLVITTSSAWLARCAQVVFLDAGRTRTGSHPRLLATDPAYRGLVQR